MKSHTLATWMITGVTLVQGWALAIEPSPDFVVAPNGSDGAAGSVAAPFATLTRARDAVRELRRQRPERAITVLVRGGTYRLDAAIELTSEDSGAAAGKTTYAAWPGERPVFSGGQVIKGLRAGADGVWRANVGELRFEQLYVDGRRAVRARTPHVARLCERRGRRRGLLAGQPARGAPAAKALMRGDCAPLTFLAQDQRESP